MSRSLGDKMAKSCGVISTPLFQERAIGSKDQYIVIASDGVWDMLENIEVVNFIERWKGQSITLEAMIILLLLAILPFRGLFLKKLGTGGLAWRIRKGSLLMIFLVL